VTQTTNKASLQQVIEKLENLFSMFNDHFYNGELQTPVITASPNRTKNAYGWCTGWKAWKGKNEGGYYEINLCAEYLSRPFLDVCETLIHEMVHLANLQNEIKDTSRGGTYHNKEFKITAKSHGLTVSKTKSGWNKTALTDETTEWLKSTLGNEAGFTLYREKLLKLSAAGVKKQSSRKYVCLCCGTIIRATKEVNVTCSDCDEPFELAI
jgi:hypothetical protein